MVVEPVIVLAVAALSVAVEAELMIEEEPDALKVMVDRFVD